MKNESFYNKLKNILIFDKIRVLKICELLQFTIVMTIISISFSYILNKFIFIEKDKEYYETLSLFKLIIFTIIDLIIIIVTYYYMKKITYLIPSIGNLFFKEFIPFTTSEYFLHIPGLYIYLELIDGLKEKVGAISKKIGNRNSGFLI